MKANKIFPFLWHHGESEDLILREIEKIYNCGIRSFCVESRPHPDFCGERWWKDMGFILQEAKKREMQVWLLDDKGYPSGSANNAVERHPELQQTNVMLTHMDVCGPLSCGKILLSVYGKEDKLVAALAFPSIGDKIDFYSGVDVTDKVFDKVLYWDVPEGAWRVFGIFTSKKTKAWNFVDILNPKSTALMIEEIYQPHYDHFSDYFGNTFVGFFSDEPRFGNGTSEGVYVTAPWHFRGLGKMGMAHPWSDEILSCISPLDYRVLISLWLNLEIPECAEFRIRYMNFITDKFSENFSGMLGKWCEEHGVLYSGHIIEDLGAHSITCCSAGHYFKSTTGQAIAGIDIIFNQVNPDFMDGDFAARSSIPYVNEAFYHYMLPKLASSAARLDDRKEGNAVCEIFGAFGWGESISKMKRLIDFCLVRGINHFIPHAFNPKEDDTDCPPYFYYGGRNPQYDSFKTLSEYTLKMCEKFSGGKAEIKVAILYHVEAMWNGYSYYPMEKLCSYLMKKQINFDIVPEYEIEEISNDGIRTKNCFYQHLLIPYSGYLCANLRRKFIDKKSFSIIGSEEDLNVLELRRFSSYRLKDECSYIRVMKYIKESKIFYLIVNEGKTKVTNTLEIAEKGYYTVTDEHLNLSESGKTEGGLPFTLEVGQSVVFEVGDIKQKEKHFVFTKRQECEHTWKIYISNAPFEKWELYDETKELYDLAGIDHLPDFCGKIRYQSRFTFNGKEKCLFDFGKSDCGIRVWLNGQDLGERICAPYIFDSGNAIRNGENIIEIVITTTLGLKNRDEFSHYAAIGKYGLPKNPTIYSYQLGEKQ